MKLLVPILPVPDQNVPIRLAHDGQGADLAAARYVQNPFDEVALEAALCLKEAGQAESVLAVSCGAAHCSDVLRIALALGADRALHVVTDAPLDALSVAKLLAALVRRESIDLVLCGKQAADSDAGDAPGMLAGFLGWGMAPCVSGIRLNDKSIEVQCETELGQSGLRLDLPAVLSADLRLNTPRYVTLQNTIKARKMPIETTTPQELDVRLMSPAWQVQAWAEHRPERRAQRVADVDDLLRQLQAVGAL